MMRQKAPIPKSRTKIGVFLVALMIVTLLSSSSVIGLQFSANVIGEDNEPPLVADPTAIPASIAANGVQEAQLSVNVTDRSGIYSVTVDLTPIGGPEAKALEKEGSSDTYSTTTTAAFGTAPGTYSLRINATDNSANKNSNTSESILLTVTSPQVITYDFSTNASVDRWAYRNQHNERPPITNNVPTTEFSSRRYTLIAADDRRRQEDSSSRRGYYALHRFEFTIAEEVGNITRMDVLWSGQGRHQLARQHGATLYIWNYNTRAYEQLDQSFSRRPGTLESTILSNFGDYLDDDGRLMLIAEQNSPQLQFWRSQFRSRIGTDYVKVDITL
jgi:hypothetical protein